MKVFRLPVQCSAVLFDMDCTLYSHPEYGRLQVDLLIEKLARLRGKTFDEMNNEITLFKNKWAKEHQGQQISIGNTFTHFGISIRENVQWREELCQPEQYLALDRQLRSALEQLESRYALAVVTNNPVSIAKRTLSVLGVGDLFQVIVGLDTCGVSKPSEEMFMRAATLCGAAPESCVSVGDRYDIDVALPLELGMGGILVDGVEDVYNLPEVIFP
jgi:phosphoglycolate phosphatase/putative hydrolase of the HAD superfamily